MTKILKKCTSCLLEFKPQHFRYNAVALEDQDPSKTLDLPG